MSILDTLKRSGTVAATGTVAANGTAAAPGLSAPLPPRAAALLDLRPRHRGLGAADLPEIRHGRHRMEPAGRRLADRYRQDTDVDMSIGRAQRLPQRFDPALPGNAAKLAAVEELIKISADVGCSPTCWQPRTCRSRMTSWTASTRSCRRARR
jgi:hypothetical protein